MQQLGNLFARFSRRFLPDPLVIACGLTLLVVSAAVLAPQVDRVHTMGGVDRLRAVAGMWFEGIWSIRFLRFALQMCLVLLTGYGLAKAPAATRLLKRIAAPAASNRSAVLCITAVSCVGCWINWGFGLIAAGILAGELRDRLRRKGVHCQDALIVAGAYAGMMIWHGGLSGSAPLEIAGRGVTISRAAAGGDRVGGAAGPEGAGGVRGKMVEGSIGGGGEGSVEGIVELPPLGIDRTLFSPGNLVLSAILIAGVPLLLRSMAARGGGEPEARLSAAVPQDPAPEPAPDGAPAAAVEPGPAEAVNRSRALPRLIALLGVIALGGLLYDGGAGAVDLNFVITVFLVLGLLLHRDLPAYGAAVADGGRAVTGIILQFPLYSGIQSVMFQSGLTAAVSEAFVAGSVWSAELFHVSPGTTFPAATFLSAGLVNLFVPSGGGQWIVQGPIMCGASEALGLPLAQTVMAVSYGDQWTNMIQPFWAIPLMGLTGVDVRRFMGYCALLMLAAAPVFLLGLILLY